MSVTRNNHFVPQWYQEGFFEPGRNTLAYLDMSPPVRTLPDGRTYIERGVFNSPTSRAFVQQDLYSTFFGTSVNDEIERRLFGEIDTKGALAVRAFAEGDEVRSNELFETLFNYIDIQKIRTPKGLDWLRAQYPTMTQNELMVEMQAIRALHFTIWVQGVREIVSAQNAEIKFIVSDHPVTIYNSSAPPDSHLCGYPLDPSIAMKGSQTIFPLNRDFCLIITNLEYAKDPETAALEKRTHPRNFQSTMVKTDSFIRSRQLSDLDVATINLILKSRARRHIAAGKKDWLYPERIVAGQWKDRAAVLLPPEDQLWNFGGEIFAKYDDGHVHYQDQFGRTEKPREFLLKQEPARPLVPDDICGCGSGKTYGRCCEKKPIELRQTWSERSIRERNIMFYQALSKVLDLQSASDWTQIRRELNDEKIALIYQLFEGLWPLETDLVKLLPKPDGSPRAVYTGAIHPDAIIDFALGLPLYFGEMIVAHPFVHAGIIRPEDNPVKKPQVYRQEVLKALLFFLRIFPLVDAGLVQLVPDPCDFDHHLRQQMFRMAKDRSTGLPPEVMKDDRIDAFAKADGERALQAMPREFWESKMRQRFPRLDARQIAAVLTHLEERREADPLAILHRDPIAPGRGNGLLNMMSLSPNFEIALYLAQLTGASIVTDSTARWREIERATFWKSPKLPYLAKTLSAAPIDLPQSAAHTLELSEARQFMGLPRLMQRAAQIALASAPAKPGAEQRLASSFERQRSQARASLSRSRTPARRAQLTAAVPIGGIQDNTVNRLLLMSSSERHDAAVGMAFFVSPWEH